MIEHNINGNAEVVNGKSAAPMPTWPVSDTWGESQEPRYEEWNGLPGIAGDIAAYLYNAALYRLVEGAIAGAIAYLAGIVGRAYNVDGMGLNNYIVLLAETGTGKNAAAAGINALDNAVEGMLAKTGVKVRRGTSGIVSPQGLIKSLAGNGKNDPKLCCLSLLDEVGYFFQDICKRDAKANEKGIRSVMLKLYSASGGTKRFGDMSYSDVLNNVEAMTAPAWSFFGNSTQHAFYKAVSEESITDGFIGRLALFEYPKTQPLPTFNWDHGKAYPDIQLVARLAELTTHVKNIEDAADRTGAYKWINVPFDSIAHKFNVELEAAIHAKKQQFNATGEGHLTGIWMRVREKTLRLAALFAVAVNPYNPIIKHGEINAAFKVIERGTEILTARFRSGKVGDDNIHLEQHDLLMNCIKTYLMTKWSPKFGENYGVSEFARTAGVIHHKYFYKMLHKRPAFKGAHNTSIAITTMVKTFIQAGYLAEIGKQDPIRGANTGEMYCIKNIEVC